MHRVSLCRGVAGNYRLFNRLNADYLRQKAAILRGSGCQASRRVREQAQKKRLSRRCLLLRTSTQPRRSHEELSCYVLYGFRSPGHGPSAVRFVDTGYTLQPTPAGSVSFRVANCFAFRSFICSTRKKCVSRQAPQPPYPSVLYPYCPTNVCKIVPKACLFAMVLLEALASRVCRRVADRAGACQRRGSFYNGRYRFSEALESGCRH